MDSSRFRGGGNKCQGLRELFHESSRASMPAPLVALAFVSTSSELTWNGLNGLTVGGFSAKYGAVGLLTYLASVAT